MKQKLTGWFRRYEAALRQHLKLGSRASLRPAPGLGRRAVKLGMETLELARLHERATVALKLSGRKDGAKKRAEIFFAEAIAPIMERHRAARPVQTDLNQLNHALTRRTQELAAARRQLQRGLAQRQGVETTFQKSGRHYARLLKNSRQLQEGLRQLTRRVLAAQEEQRLKISRELQDEVAQTLVGVNLRLLFLKQEARVNTRGLQEEIISTQRLVAQSARSVRRVARGIRNA